MALVATFLRKYPWQCLLLVCALLIAGVADGLSLSTLLPLLQLAFDEPSEGSALSELVLGTLERAGLAPSIGLLLGVILIGIFAKNLLVFLATQRIGYIAADVATELRMNLLRAVTASRWSFYVDQSTGELANSMATEALRASNAYVFAVRLLAVMIETVVYAVMAVMVSWQATLICCSVSIVIVSISHQLVRISHRAGTSQTTWYRSLAASLTDLLSSVKPFKAMGRDRIAEHILADDTSRLQHALKREVLGNAALEAGQEPMYISVIAGGMFLSLVVFEVELAIVTFMVLILARLLKRIGKVQKTYQRMMACESAYFAMDATIKRARSQAEITTGEHPPTLSVDIHFADVDFAYRGQTVLRGADFSIPAGKFTTLIGESGVGKSTVGDLIIGLIQPDAGHIEIDGIALDTLNLEAWRRQLGYVPQENLLLHRSVLVNVTLGDASLDAADAELALRAAGAWEFVTKLTDGLDSVVGERGARLSGGQRQRIMLARALVHGPRLLILDEATSALDERTEAEICETLRKLVNPLTIFAVTHQRALAKVADYVLLLEQGKVSPITR